MFVYVLMSFFVYALMFLGSYVLTFFFEFLCSYVCICCLESWFFNLDVKL